MQASRPFLRHWFGVLIRENFLGLCLVLATGTSLVVQAIVARTLGWPLFVPISFLGIYLGVHLRSVNRLADQTFRAVPLPYSVCLGQSHDWYEAAIRQQEQTLHDAKIAWDPIQRTFRVHRIDWSYFNETRIPLYADAWKDRIREIVRHFDHLTNRIPIQPVYHLFFAAPAPVTLALGAKIGRRVPINVYQHAGMVRDPYAKVFSSEEISRDEGYHLLNKRVDAYNLIEITPSSGDDGQKGSALVVLDFTGHELPKPYPDVQDADTTYVQLKGIRGHIPLKESWIDLAHELSSLIFSFVDDDRRVHLLPGIPSSLAFIVGTIVGTIPGVVLYHYNRHDGAYSEGFSLEDL